MSEETNSSGSTGAPHPASHPASSNVDLAKQHRWERDVLEKLVFANLKEQRAKRRWSIFFRLCFLVLFAAAVFRMYDWDNLRGEESSPHTAIVSIEGEIDADGAGSAGVVIPALNRAFADDNAAGIILHINSPGGSPVQAGMINDELARLKMLHPKKPVYVVVDELCASAAYYIAAGADRIYVDKASVVGSIGVLMDGFGFTGLMDKLGIERRLMTAGENKGGGDPFSPQSAKDKEHQQAMLNEIHQQFINVVRKGRGMRLKETPDMFTGLYWSGAKAIDLGLADGLGSVDHVARDVLKAEELVDYTQHEDLSERMLKRFGASFTSGVAKTMRTQAARNIVH